MATEEWVRKALQSGKLYEELPPRVRSLLPQSEWKQRVKEYCIHRGYSWGNCLAKSCCTEQEYYEDLMRYYKQNHRLFPYHLADYVCRIMRVTPFRYYCDVLFNVLKEEKQYDQLPNFTATDAVRVVGVGRNEYIAILNQCRGKRLMWRVNKGLAREYLPSEPLDLQMEHWWLMNVVNLGEAEYRNVNPEEKKILQDAARPGGCPVGDADRSVVMSLYKQGLIYLDVPIQPDDHIAIPPLEGFVSNKDSELSETRGDPLEALLYAVFVATSERATVSELATILNVDINWLRTALSMACRMGFGSKVTGKQDSLGMGQGDSLVLDLDEDPETAVSGSFTEEKYDDGAGVGSGCALVVDSEVTGYLMMGALSPGLKRHSVTLFEGGRITGSDSISELISELRVSIDASASFEGEMRHLASYARALLIALECVKGAMGNRPVEILRKENLAGLTPTAAFRVLSHAYAAVVPITPLPYPPLPLPCNRPGPTNFGPTAEAATPWLQLLFYTAMHTGPPALVLVAGQRLNMLPPELCNASHALIWPWNSDAVRAQRVPVCVEATFLLCILNEYLLRTALMIIPLRLQRGFDLPATLDIPLPLDLQDAASSGTSLGVVQGTEETVKLPLPEGVVEGVERLGLGQALGSMRLLPVVPGSRPLNVVPLGLSKPQAPDAKYRKQNSTKSEPKNGTLADSPSEAPLASVSSSLPPAASTQWIPLQINLGLPLIPVELCTLVCQQATACNFLESSNRKAQSEGKVVLQESLYNLISQYGACSNCLAAAGNKDNQFGYVDPPVCNLYFDGTTLSQYSSDKYIQGVSCWCAD